VGFKGEEGKKGTAKKTERGGLLLVFSPFSEDVKFREVFSDKRNEELIDLVSLPSYLLSGRLAVKL